MTAKNENDNSKAEKRRVLKAIDKKNLKEKNILK